MTVATTRAVIFDMDGVISDTQVLHSGAEEAVLREYGIELSATDIMHRFAGVADDQMFEEIFKEAGENLPSLDEIIERKWVKMDAINTDAIVEIAGARILIEQLHGLGVPLGVASGSPLAFIHRVLSELRLIELFDALTSTDEVEHGKPAPDIFLLAAKKLNTEPNSCAVIEDGLSGMIAAKEAGMRCVGLLTHVHKNESPADANVYDLREISLDLLGIPTPEKM